jgi:hypothetical protein
MRKKNKNSKNRGQTELTRLFRYSYFAILSSPYIRVIVIVSLTVLLQLSLAVIVITLSPAAKGTVTNQNQVQPE